MIDCREPRPQQLHLFEPAKPDERDVTPNRKADRLHRVIDRRGELVGRDEDRRRSVGPREHRAGGSPRLKPHAFSNGEFDPRQASDRTLKSLSAFRIGGDARFAGDQSQPAMAVREQMLGRQPAACHVVGAAEVGLREGKPSVYSHERHAPFPDLLQIDLWNRFVRRPEDDSVDPLVEQTVEIFALGLVALGVRPLAMKVQHRQRVVRDERVVDAVQDSVTKRHPRRNHHADHAAAAAFERVHQPVRAVLQPLGCFEHALPRVVGHVAAVVERPRHRHHRHARFLGDLLKVRGTTLCRGCHS